MLLVACGEDSQSGQAGSSQGEASGTRDEDSSGGRGGEVRDGEVRDGASGVSHQDSDGGAIQDGAAGTPLEDTGMAATSDAGVVEAGTSSVCPSGPFPAPVVGASQVACDGFKLNYSYNEGPTWIAAQKAFFFSNFVQFDAMHGDIIKYTPGSSCEVFISEVGCNGLAVAPDGNLLAACHQSRSVIKFDVVTKKPTTLAALYMNLLLDTPNDLVAHSNGSIYFTNPTYELDGRPAGVGMATFFRDPSGKLALLAKGGMPNGIALSPDEKRLYVIGAGTWDIDDEGVPSNRQSTFVTGDGMAVDCAGNVYLSGGVIKSPNGNDVGSFPAGTNLTFGGADRKTLIVVGPGTSVRTYAMNVPGLP